MGGEEGLSRPEARSCGFNKHRVLKYRAAGERVDQNNKTPIHSRLSHVMYVAVFWSLPRGPWMRVSACYSKGLTCLPQDSHSDHWRPPITRLEQLQANSASLQIEAVSARADLWVYTGARFSARCLAPPPRVVWYHVLTYVLTPIVRSV